MTGAGHVLILAGRFDPTCDLMVEELNRRAVPVFRADMAEFPLRLTLAASLSGNRWHGTLAHDRRTLDLASVRSVYYRRPTRPKFPEQMAGEARKVAETEARWGIATASVRRIPPSWLERCRVGGILVVPLKGTLAGGMIARLTKLPDGTAAGRILHTPAAFMPLKTGTEAEGQVPEIPDRPCRDAGLSGRVLDDWTFSFFAQLHMPRGLIRTYGRSDDGLHVTTLYDPAGGSATRIEDMAEGTPLVTSTGPHDLWTPIEAAHRRWRQLHRPRREWFSIEATPAEQTVTYTAPDGRVHRWTI
ncbi:ATP-dependent carboxylate-amine ligase [Streptomyces sp. Je 1-4]|uniref:MvdC/MvdD family ATP grasp protein n=1 Tax=Streptomyces TaxID=1883 RepID=UPI0021D8959F|nr:MULTISPECIES: ATP-dependent carboxylate-amine ligase [unclassified Streptomyces]UYB40323.1 ATP-dependent carboxylate-amine ligase [Streptomyces sp. Je 1-4]UZQ36432.1 ATP-dependent carboxylate-amine ligase [Streptomyces sp. Je 1-4] [Streptomyces sp. Je 1-4 4N24]UZQ43850.1 ATP-dependent carboxylate-amine ligase [Streptomyces sp. Je 1-4] [Streptomyces sp. Je 1-4 4N24_ara]